jgi:hypothetical protein
LSNPNDFIDGGSIEKDAETILVDSCGIAGCHDDITKAAELDLLSPDVESRLVDQNAKWMGCESRTLVVAGVPDSSYLLDKVLGAAGICESQMPLLGSLSADEIEMLRQWIIDLGGSGGGTSDGG